VELEPPFLGTLLPEAPNRFQPPAGSPAPEVEPPVKDRAGPDCPNRLQPDAAAPFGRLAPVDCAGLEVVGC